MATKETPQRAAEPITVSLQVPPSVNLASMSTAEIEKLALELSRNAASAFPKDSVFRGVERVNLTSSSQPALGIDILISWSRDCGLLDLGRDVKVDPTVFQNPVAEHISTTAKSLKASIEGKAPEK